MSNDQTNHTNCSSGKMKGFFYACILLLLSGVLFLVTCYPFYREGYKAHEPYNRILIVSHDLTYDPTFYSEYGVYFAIMLDGTRDRIINGLVYNCTSPIFSYCITDVSHDLFSDILYTTNFINTSISGDYEGWEFSLYLPDLTTDCSYILRLYPEAYNMVTEEDFMDISCYDGYLLRICP